MATLSGNHYEILGISPDADRAQIKRAWGVRVREHSADTDPEGNRLLNEARSTLSDPEARAEYDTTLRLGAAGQQIREEINFAKELDDWQTAVNLLRELVAIEPESGALRSELAFALAAAGRMVDAIDVLAKLLKSRPDVAKYWADSSQLRQIYAEHAGSGAAVQLVSAEREARRAVELQPDSRHYLLHSMALCLQDKWPEAAQVCEEGIYADDELAFDDMELLLRLAMIRARLHDGRGFEEALAKIRRVTPSGEEARSYVARQLAGLAGTMADLGYTVEIAEVTELAKELYPSNPEFIEALDHYTFCGQLTLELYYLRTDASIPVPIEQIAANDVDLVFGELARQDYDSAFEAAASQLGSVAPHAVAEGVRRLLAQYPQIASIDRQYWEMLLAQVALAPPPPPSYSTPASPMPTSGCVLPILASFLALIGTTVVAASSLLR